MHDRILFVLKFREGYWGGSCLSSGLRNSVGFLVGMLHGLGIEAKMAEVEDNNSIDREVTAYRPTHVIIEAFWVVPEKFDVLKRLHPTVSWIVRNHSEVPFLANEGIAFGWLAGYLQRGVEVMCNAPRAVKDVRNVALSYGISDRLVTYGPNYYPIEASVPVSPHMDQEDDKVRVGCFGAIRPLKNTMAQALAALAFARHANKKLAFYVNAGRVEGNGDPVLKNLKDMFRATQQHELVEVDWLPHTEFLHVMGVMDIALQVSFSETFNIVAADAVAVGVPVVVSSEVPWIGRYADADPTDIGSIASAMVKIWNEANPAQRLARQRADLTAYCRNSEAVWTRRFAAQAVA